MNLEFGSSISVKGVYAQIISGGTCVLGGKIFEGGTCLASLYAPIGGSGIAWAGSTNNGIATYASASEACSEPNLTFDGSTLSVTGNIALTTNAARCIIIPTGTITPAYSLCIQGQSYDATSSAGVAGAVCVVGGVGGSSGSGANGGGSVTLSGGLGCNTNAGQQGYGGAAYLCGGCGCGTGGASGFGGHVCIVGGVGSASTGSVYLYESANLKLNTMATGVCVTGCLNASVNICATTLVCAPTVCATTLSKGAIVCSTTCVKADTCMFAVDFIASSDSRVKKCVRPISNALSIVTQLQGVNYQMCDDENHEARIGFIAQDVQRVLPQIVSHSTPTEDDAKYGITDDKLGLKYDKLTAVLVEAIKEQQKQIDFLTNELYNIKSKIV